MKSSEQVKVAFVVVGCGVAGLRAAIELAAAGKVLILTKSPLADPGTSCPPEALAAALCDEDEIGLHYQETINAGEGLCHVPAVKALLDEGPKEIEHLLEWNARLDRTGSRLLFSREAGHGRSRVLHAQDGSTGWEIHRTLLAKACSLANIRMLPQSFTTDLLRDDHGVRGVRYLDAKSQTLHEVHANAVLLATGGLGQVFRETTNPAVSTGDGLALAYRAGAALRDMEFIQFHPTALYVQCAPRLPLTEALRAEGACLRNVDLLRFMARYHEAGDLAARDVVARAIVSETVRTASPFVYLDMTALDPEFIRKRFPRIYSTCLNYNIDITTDLVPVTAAAHYAMGGVASDLDGRTSLEGLWVAGEVASTGLHGANRLASNSLLEGLVFGARAGRALAGSERPRKAGAAALADPDGKKASAKNHRSAPDSVQAQSEMLKLTEEIRALAWKYVGIIRTGKELESALVRLQELANRLPGRPRRRDYEAANMATVAALVAHCALAREESRGGHYRSDFPFRVDDKLQKHSLIFPNSPVAFE